MQRVSEYSDGLNEVYSPLKLYIMIPDEIACQYPVGKIIAHAAHNAAIITYEHKGMQRVDEWYLTAMTKIVVRVPWTISELKELVNSMHLRHYPAAMIEDNTVGTELCAAIGPFSDEEAEYFKFNELKLF